MKRRQEQVEAQRKRTEEEKKKQLEFLKTARGGKHGVPAFSFSSQLGEVSIQFLKLARRGKH